MSKRDIGASVRQRLLNEAHNQGRRFQELLQYFAMERFLYRLSMSPYRDRFILKGALLLTAWHAPQSRPTVDIDLAGKTNNEPGHIQTVIREICTTVETADGLLFDPATVTLARIKEDAEYEGVRARFQATLSRARIGMQIDIRFGDTIVPEPTLIEYPAILKLPSPVLLGYRPLCDRDGKLQHRKDVVSRVSRLKKTEQSAPQNCCILRDGRLSNRVRILGDVNGRAKPLFERRLSTQDNIDTRQQNGNLRPTELAEVFREESLIDREEF